MPPTTLGPSLPAWDALPFPVLAGTAAALVVLLAWLLIRRHLLHPGVRALLHPLGSGTHEVACCLRGMDLSNIQAGDRVVIFGAGPMGAIMLQLSKLYGASEVIMVEPQPGRIRRAEKLGAADDALRASTLDWVILRPGLVIAPTAHGGTSLIRALAAFPIVQPLVLADARMQTVHVADVARATVRALSDPALKHQTFDLGEAQPHTLGQIVAAFRGWLGFAPASRAVPVPRFIGNAIGKLADIAGLLGWRAPLRTTALRVLADGVLLDPEPWRKATGETLRSLDDTLRDLPATRQERSFARIELIFPVLVAGFALFWIASGVIGLIEREAAARIVEGALGPMPARAAVIAGSLADIAIGAFMLRRKTFRSACTAAALLSFGYLVLGTLITPQLWSDPLGPLLKIAPIIGCALMLASYAEER
mgnify:CR=1 FL=1